MKKKGKNENLERKKTQPWKIFYRKNERRKADGETDNIKIRFEAYTTTIIPVNGLSTNSRAFQLNDNCKKAMNWAFLLFRTRLIDEIE